MSDPKNPSDPPVIKICEWGPLGLAQCNSLFLRQTVEVTYDFNI